MHEKAFAALVERVQNLADHMVYPSMFASAGQKIIGGSEEIGGFQLTDEGDELFTQIVEDTLYKKAKWNDKFSTKHIHSEINSILLAAAEARSYAPIEPGLRKLVDAYATCDHEYRIVIPLVGLEMGKEPLALGRVTLKLYHPEALAELRETARSILMANTYYSTEWKEKHFASFNERYFQALAGNVCAEAVVKGEMQRAKELALEEINRTLDLLRYAVLFTYTKDVRREIGILGDVSKDSLIGVAIRTNLTGANYFGEIVNHNFPLHGSHIELMREIGVFALAELWNKPNRTEFEDMLLRAVHWLSSAQTQKSRENTLLNLVTCLETFFKTPKDAPITANISEGVAYLTKEGSEERKKRKRRVASFYAKRSTLTHEGDGEITSDELTELTLIARDMTLLMIQHRDRFVNVKAFQEWLEDQKLSGTVAWPAK